MTEDDPMLTMLKWLCEKLMETEVNAKINAAKSVEIKRQGRLLPPRRKRL